jgi:hypothetical protein
MASPDRHFANAAIFTQSTGITPNSGDAALYIKSDNQAYIKNSSGVERSVAPLTLTIACSDEVTALTTGNAKVTLRAPFAFRLTDVRSSLTTAPTGSTLVVDINNGVNSALSTKLSIDATELTSVTAAVPAVIDATYQDFANDASITIDIDQIGSTVAGAGLKVCIYGTRL